MISKDEFVSWKSHPVTEYIFQELHASRALLAENLMDGRALHDHVAMAAWIGEIRGINTLLAIRYEDVVDENVAEENV